MNELERRPPRSAEERRLVARERARERTRRQRRLGVVLVGGIVVLVGAGWFTLGHGGGSPKAADACSYVASVCPTATQAPASTNRSMTAIAPGSSGASVTWRSVPAAAVSRSSIESESGARRAAGS